MIKNYKKYVSNPNVGDYVYCEEKGISGKLYDFIYSNIGQIISKKKYFSKNKEELELRLQSKKYNI